MEELRRDFGFVFVHSGAHSFFVEEGMVSFRERKESLDSPNEWFRDYLQFVLENHELADAFTEFDVDVLVGIEQVLEWRKQAIAAGCPREKFIPVFHSTIGNNALTMFEEWCQEFPYVATEGGGGQTSAISDGIGGQRKLLEIAKKHGARLHSFAMTGTEALRRIPYFSVDSTSWLAGSMYGVTCILKGNRLASVQQKDSQRRQVLRKQVLHLLEQRGVDIPTDIQGGYLADEGKAVDWVHAAMWVEWEASLTANWQKAGVLCTCLEGRGS